MFTITTTYKTNANGTGQMLAKGHGKQRTINIDNALNAETNAASAVGALLNVLCDERQKAMLLHPSGGQRVRVDAGHLAADFAVKRIWSINV